MKRTGMTGDGKASAIAHAVYGVRRTNPITVMAAVSIQSC
jgi:hypothetical protein